MLNNKLERFLKSWVDGELEPDQAAEVAAYLKSNPRAQATVADYRKVADVIRRVARRTPVPMPRPETIARRARCQEQEERQVIQWLQRLTAAAALLLVTTLGMLVMSSSSSAAGDPVLASPEEAEVPLLDVNEPDPFLPDAMILALNDPSWEIEYR